MVATSSTRRYFQYFLLFDCLYKYQDDIFLFGNFYGEVFLTSNLPTSEGCVMDLLELGRFIRILGFGSFRFKLGVPKRRKKFKSFSFYFRSRSIFTFFDIFRTGVGRDIRRNGLSFSFTLSRGGLVNFCFKELGELDSLGSVTNDFFGWTIPLTFSFFFPFRNAFYASFFSSLGFFVKNCDLFSSELSS